MPTLIAVDDLHDPRLAAYMNLRGNRVDSSAAGHFIVEGRWCVQRLAQSRHPIQSVVVEQGREESVIDWVPEGTPIFSIAKDRIRELVGYDFHRGMLACGTRPSLLPVDRVRLSHSGSNLALAVLGVSEQENLGSMIRSAAALGVSDLMIGPRTIDPYARRTIRVSMATVLNQTLYNLDVPKEQLCYLARENNYRTLVTTLDEDATPLHRFVPDDRPMVLVVGNEAGGVEADVQAIATDRVTIPMQQGIDSLNVAVATAILLYELGKK